MKWLSTVWGWIRDNDCPFSSYLYCHAFVAFLWWLCTVLVCTLIFGLPWFVGNFLGFSLAWMFYTTREVIQWLRKGKEFKWIDVVVPMGIAQGCYWGFKFIMGFAE